MHRRTRALGLATTALCALAFAAAPKTAAADVIQLGFIVDSSGSIGQQNFNTIRTGLANAVNTLIPTDGTYELSVVDFASNAFTVINHVLIDSATTRASVANDIQNMTFIGTSTDYAEAFQVLQAAFAGSRQTVTASYVNFATDGDPDSISQANAARNAIIAAGVDNISIEGISVTPSTAAYLQNSICYPGPCDNTVPYNFPTQGFYISVASAADYSAAIATKISTVTGVPVPEPASLALFGVGLMGLGLARRRTVL